MKGEKDGMPPQFTSALHEAQILYKHRIEKENFDRVMRLRRIKRNNLYIGLGLAGSVLGIYLYSIFSVKQEHFLDEMDERKALES